MDDSNRKEVQEIAARLRGLDRLAEAFGRMFPAIANLAIAYDVSQEKLSEIPEMFDGIKRELENIKRAIILQGSDQQQERVRSITAELREEMFDGLVESLKERLRTCIQERNQLLEDSAKYGADVPFRITKRLIDVNESIDHLRGEINNLMELDK